MEICFTMNFNFQVFLTLLTSFVIIKQSNILFSREKQITTSRLDLVSPKVSCHTLKKNCPYANVKVFLASAIFFAITLDQREKKKGFIAWLNTFNSHHLEWLK